LDRFDLEFFGVTLTTHGTSYLGLIMRLGGVYETRGDSKRQLAPTVRIRLEKESQYKLCLPTQPLMTFTLEAWK
uniref:hypothetical protein n=1 Tax=Pseudomonas putida TaxID=303 RepID=UPI00301D651C